MKNIKQWRVATKEKIAKSMGLTDEDAIEVLYYGLDVLVLNGVKLAVVFLIAWLLGLLLPTLICFIGFCSLRTFAFGVHSGSSFVCTFATVVAFIGAAFIAIQIPSSLYLVGVPFMCLVLLFRYAPADTEARPIPSVTQRKQLKSKSVLSYLVVLVAGLILLKGSLLHALLLGQLLECICITPIIYQWTGKGYRNYEQFNETTCK